MRAVGEMNDRLKRTDYEIEKTEKWLKDTNRQIMSNYELMKYYLNEVKELRRQEDIEQAAD